MVAWVMLVWVAGDGGICWEYIRESKRKKIEDGFLMVVLDADNQQEEQQVDGVDNSGNHTTFDEGHAVGANGRRKNINT